MSRSAKGNSDNPGKNVRAKSGLNKSILDQGWGIFISQLEYKLKFNGVMLIRIPPQYTSQRCSDCGHTHADNRYTQEKFECVSCGQKENADLNAAKNILAAGNAGTARGGNTVVLPKKRESSVLAA